MGDLCLFLNTRIENSGVLADVGDFCLAPVRYWCYGNTVRIDRNYGDRVDHVASFHHDRGSSRTNPFLESSETGMFKAIVAIALLVPGLFLGVICKTFAYLSSDMRDRHDFAKRHFTPIVRHIGTAENPIQDEDELLQALNREFIETLFHQPTDAIVIHGRDLDINIEPGILRFNPMKLILEGARIVHEPLGAGERLGDEMVRSNKWGAEPLRRGPDVGAENVGTIDEALQASLPRRGWFTCKRTHQVFTVQ